MKNKYPAICYHCRAGVAKGAGLTKPTAAPDPGTGPKWYTIHKECLKKRAKLAEAQNKAEAAAINSKDGIK